MASPKRPAWGAHHYTHFFFTLDATPPFAVSAVGPEFCLGASPRGTDCEVVQYVSGMARDNATGELLLSYGVNDCEARVARLALDEVRRMLQPWPPR